MHEKNFPVLETARLVLRPWTDADLAPLAEMSADPRVMEFFPKPLDRDESDALAARIRAHFDRHGFGMWAVQLREGADFIGILGLSVPTWEAHFTPCVEIGWRLAHAHWGRGYATEGAHAALAFGFDELHLEEIVALTSPTNRRSRNVMERLGMTCSPADDFNFPTLPAGHPLAPHVLYRLRRQSK